MWKRRLRGAAEWWPGGFKVQGLGVRFQEWDVSRNHIKMDVHWGLYCDALYVNRQLVVGDVPKCIRTRVPIVGFPLFIRVPIWI